MDIGSDLGLDLSEFGTSEWVFGIFLLPKKKNAGKESWEKGQRNCMLES